MEQAVFMEFWKQPRLYFYEKNSSSLPDPVDLPPVPGRRIQLLASEPVETGKPFPDFTLIFTNKSRKEVRLLDSFYPANNVKPDIILEIWDGEAKKMAYYWARYRVERSVANMKFTALKPGIPFRVPIRNFAKHVIYLHPLERGKKYLMKVTYRDDYGTPSHSVGYVARKEFVTK